MLYHRGSLNLIKACNAVTLIILLILIAAQNPAQVSAQQEIELVDISSRNLLHRYITVLEFEGEDLSYQYLTRQLVSKLESKLYSEPSFRLQANLLSRDASGDYSDKCLALGSDLLLGGRYSVKNDRITIKIFVYDYFKKGIAIRETLTTSLFMTNELEVFADSIMASMVRIYAEYDKILLETVLKSSRGGNPLEKKLAENLLLQPGKLQLYTIKKFKVDYLVPVHVTRPSIVIINDNNQPVTVSIDDFTTTTDQVIIPIALPGDTSGSIAVKISTEGEKEQTHVVQVTAGNPVIEVKPLFLSTREIKPQKFYIETASSISTMGYIGQNIKFGISIPFKSKLDNSIYFNIFIAGKMIHPLDKYLPGFEPRNLKARLGIGYQHMFYFKNIIGLGPAFETGFLFYAQSFVNVENKFVSFDDDLQFTLPSFYLSLPLTVEFLPFNRVTPILVIEPIIRLGMRFFTFDDTQWIDPFEIDNMDKNLFRWGIDSGRTGVPGTTVHFLFYDLPFYLGIRIKL
jgi:hypothetical protein